jgi:hemoglobin-like flavoprotein
VEGLDSPNDFAKLASAYASIASILKEDASDAAELLKTLRQKLIETKNSADTDALAQAYAAIASGLLNDKKAAADEVKALEGEIAKPRDLFEVLSLTQAYLAVAAKVAHGERRIEVVLKTLRQGLPNTWEMQYNTGPMGFIGTQNHRRIATAYATATSNPSDPFVTSELAALREAVYVQSDDDTLFAYNQAYAALADKLTDRARRRRDRIWWRRGARRRLPIAKQDPR